MKKKVEMNKHLFWVFIIFIFLAACRNKEQQPIVPFTAIEERVDTGEQINPDQNEELIIIRFVVEEYELPVYNSLTPAFEIENPGIKITLISSTEVLGDSFANGDSITIGRLMAESSDAFSSRYAPPYKQEQFIRDLTPFMNTDPGFNSDDFYPNTLQEINGRIYTLPILINFSLIFYNKDIFDAANLAYPQSSWTWNDFRATANALTIRDRDVVTQWGFAKPFLNWASLFETQLTSPLIDANTDPPTIRFEDSDVMVVAQQYESLFLVDQAAQAFADVTLIEDGKVAMWPGSYRTHAAHSQNQNLGIVTYPVAPANHNGQPVTLLGVDGFVMSATSRNPDAVWKWLKFLSYQGMLTDAATLPARISVAETNKFWQNVSPDLAETIRYALETGRPFIPNPVYDILDQTMNAVIREEKNVETAFAQAKSTAENFTATMAELADELPSSAPNNLQEVTVSDSVTINFWLLNQANLESYRALARQFEANTNVRVNFRFPVPGRDYPDFSNAAQASDCFRWLHLRNSDYQTAVLNLDPLIASDPTFDLEDFFPIAIDQFKAQGQMWGLPADLNLPIIEYNKDLFDAASLPYPTSVWTTDDFLNIAIALTKGNGQNKQFGFVPDIGEMGMLEHMMAQREAQFIDYSIDPPTTAFTATTTIDAMRWYANLSAEYSVKPLFPVDSINLDLVIIEEFPRLIREQRAAMWSAYTLPLPNDIRQTLNIGAVPLPAGADDPELKVPGFGYYISANTAQPQACWEWIKLLTESVGVLSGIPARRSVAESTAFSQQVGAEHAEAYLISLARMTTNEFPTRSAEVNWWMFPYELWLARAHDQITMNNVGVEVAMASAQQTFDAYRTCVIDKNAFDNYESQTQCALEVDPSLIVILGHNK